MTLKKPYLLFIGLLALLLGLSWYHLVVSDVNNLSIGDHFSAIFNFDEENFRHLISIELRIPRLIIALIAGAALAISGMLTQTLFKNPLADPFVLGINAGAGLFVATGMLSGFSLVQSNIGIVTLAIIGASSFALLLLFFSNFLRNTTSLLIIGIMIGSFAGALTSVAQYLSTPDSIKSYMIWGMGSLQQVNFDQLGIILGCFALFALGTLFLIKALNALVLGETQAGMLGINIKRNRILILLFASALAGLVTAFCGPIAFVGLAIPNLCRMLFKTQNHLTLFIANILVGPIFLISCDILIQLMQTTIHIPINAFTSILGAPFVVLIILKRWS